eukprot:CAMPEP_0195523472 /NCGR_PEP_ID=MMETSP0794_2-20130614/22693_1 /TAXON_ID=515487 /ORGANISM="Stephanopyxis turris, Strain CCMP 815" /LENGTH=626 /DNA_ID=CAMNT_0040653483 /DNA_START=36 /DNA_END=1916 /DNA_ORIENTATION=-
MAREARESFLRRLEEQQEGGATQAAEQKKEEAQEESPMTPISKPKSMSEDDAFKTPLPEVVTKKNEEEQVEDDDATVSFLAAAGVIPENAIDSIDKSSLALLRQYTPRSNVLSPGASVGSGRWSFADTPAGRSTCSKIAETPKTPTDKIVGSAKAVHLTDTEIKAFSAGSTKEHASAAKEKGFAPRTIDFNHPKKEAVVPIEPLLASTTLKLKRALDKEHLSDDLPWQAQLLELLEKQNAALELLSTKVEMLEAEMEQFRTNNPRPHPSARVRSRASDLHLQHNPVVPPPPPAPPRSFIISMLENATTSIKTSYFDAREYGRKTRLWRIVSTVFREARRQNVHANLDLWLLMKLIAVVAIFGGRAKARKQENASFMAVYRTQILFVAAVLVYLLQTGLLGFFYRLIKDFPRLLKEANEEEQAAQNNDRGHTDGHDNEPVFHRRLNNNNLNANRLNLAGANNNNVVAVAPEHPASTPPRRSFTHGAIEKGGGFPTDMKYFFGSFFLSLIPTWTPTAPISAHTAAQTGNMERLEEIASSDDKDDLFEKDKNGWQPMHEAARAGNVDAVKFLVRHGGDINERANFEVGPTPLWLAKQNREDDHPLVVYLTNLGALEIGEGDEASDAVDQ